MCVCCRFKDKTEAQEIFLRPFTVCSSCKQKYVICPFVYEETNGSYPLAHLWLKVRFGPGFFTPPLSRSISTSTLFWCYLLRQRKRKFDTESIISQGKKGKS